MIEIHQKSGNSPPSRLVRQPIAARMAPHLTPNIPMLRLRLMPPIGLEVPEAFMAAQTEHVRLRHLRRHLRKPIHERAPPVLELPPPTARANLLDVILHAVEIVVALDTETVLAAALWTDDMDAFRRRVVAMQTTRTIHPEVDVFGPVPVRTVFTPRGRIKHCPDCGTPASGVTPPGPTSHEAKAREPNVRSSPYSASTVSFSIRSH